MINDLDQSQYVYKIADPSFDRRGTTVIYSTEAYGRVPLEDINRK